MTAKEILEKARSYTELTSIAYYFNGDELMQFVSQLCKEQREMCADEYSGTLINFDKRRDKEYKTIINAPQPKIFEEGGK